ncbi:hypothetical protein [Halostella sp. PRR32]|uniref:hypothetical protein n=1 Tax=Halostella sp. PRR32 TaxID=3098147 RepID=UPI002B1DDD01|nr:hypothetical protein [Halostella sp. PRR32]
MQIRALLNGSFENADRQTATRVITVLVVIAAALSMTVGTVAAQEDEPYSVEQGGECYTVTPISGNGSVAEFYDYGSPDTTGNDTNASYRSDGTNDLQEPNSSTLFLYEDPDGTLSLVSIHGANNTTSTGGAATFTITGLSDSGEWTVQDDQYNDTNNYDNWTTEGETHRIDWTWDERRTDGGAYSGLGDGFSVTIAPAFNEDAALYGEFYDGTVENWTALSGPRDDPERIALSLSETVTISAGGCGE